jgi:hypothetical protein
VWLQYVLFFLGVIKHMQGRCRAALTPPPPPLRLALLYIG